jgi:hypothetical protein
LTHADQMRFEELCRTEVRLSSQVRRGRREMLRLLSVPEVAESELRSHARYVRAKGPEGRLPG